MKSTGHTVLTEDALRNAVKPLEWVGEGHWFIGDNEGWLEEANTAFGWGYAIEFGSQDQSTWILSCTFDHGIMQFETPYEAKAAAQRDYATRIISALNTSIIG